MWANSIAGVQSERFRICRAAGPMMTKPFTALPSNSSDSTTIVRAESTETVADPSDEIPECP